ncbi:5-formaminoimidazole-4-carboxamide-1-(beta)-D-ribofuranosyl 5'-monophosphate synthetase-like protein, partial [mine drainage metagenome]
MPIQPEDLASVLASYPDRPWVGTVGSHSALDIADGAVQEGFSTIVLGQSGRDAPYRQYYRTHRTASGELRRGCVDEVWSYPRFSDLAAPAEQERMRTRGVLLVPNRALSSYLPLPTIEEALRV